MNRLEATIDSYTMRMKKGEYRWEDLEHLDNLRQIVFAKVLRGLHGFERREQRMTRSETLYGNARDEDRTLTQKRGLFGRMLG